MKNIEKIKNLLEIKNKNVILLVSGQSISKLGDSMQLVAFFWLVYTLTGSESLTSLMALSSVLPIVLFGFFSGAIIDKYNRRYILIISDAVQSIFYFSVPIMYYMNIFKIEYLFVINFVIGISRAFFYPALRSLLPNIVEKEELASVNSINVIFSQISTMIGPVLAGFLTYYIGSINLFVLNSITFIISGITIWKLSYRISEKGSSQNTEEKDEKILSSIVSGFKYVFGKKLILYLLIVFPLFTLISAGLTDIALLPFVKYIFKGTSIEYGLLESCISIGVFIGGFFTIRLGKLNKYTLFLSGICLVGLDFVLFGMNTSFSLSLLLMIMLGIAFVILEICMVTLIQENVQDNMLGRVFSLWSVMGTAGDAISYIYIAGVLSYFSVQTSFVLGGGILLAVGLIGVVFRSKVNNN